MVAHLLDSGPVFGSGLERERGRNQERESMGPDTERLELTLTVALGSVANLLLSLCIAHTWNFWRQVKWYVVLLALGNCLELFFRFAVALSVHLSRGWPGSEASCKFLMMMSTLGATLPVMAVAALSLHLLLTCLTRCQGRGARHALLAGLFSLLSLPLALAQIAMYQKTAVSHHDDYTAQCTNQFYLRDETNSKYYFLGESFVLVFFPLLVVASCLTASLIVTCSGSRGVAKGDDHPSDIVLTALLGFLVLVCCVPFHAFRTFVSFNGDASTSLIIHAGKVLKILETQEKLVALEHTRNILSAVVIVVFAYVNAFRNRGEGYTSPQSTTYSGERQKLVN